MNLDGRISLMDIITLNKAIAKAIVLDDAQKANADCCFDKVIDENDLMALMEFIVGKVLSIPYTK